MYKVQWTWRHATATKTGERDCSKTESLLPENIASKPTTITPPTAKRNVCSRSTVVCKKADRSESELAKVTHSAANASNAIKPCTSGIVLE